MGLGLRSLLAPVLPVDLEVVVGHVVVHRRQVAGSGGGDRPVHRGDDGVPRRRQLVRRAVGVVVGEPRAEEVAPPVEPGRPPRARVDDPLADEEPRHGVEVVPDAPPAHAVAQRPLDSERGALRERYRAPQALPVGGALVDPLGGVDLDGGRLLGRPPGLGQLGGARPAPGHGVGVLGREGVQVAQVLHGALARAALAGVPPALGYREADPAAPPAASA